MFDNVSKILSIFTKLIERLEKVQEKERTKATIKAQKIQSLETERQAHLDEVAAADKAIKKMKSFLED